MLTKFKKSLEQNIDLSPKLWSKIEEFASVKYLKKNEYLLKAGEVCQHGYFINKGSLVKTFLNPNGKEIVQGFYIDEVYAYLSEVTGYFSDTRSNFEIKAIENCELIEFSKQQLGYLVEHFPEFSIMFHKITSSSYQNLYMFSAMRLSLSSEDFLNYLYKNHPIILQRIPDKYIAQFMGISKEWFSKLKRRLLSNS
jgi:CRP-like cAMP-binding protein